MFLSGKSSIYGLLGDPVAHSLSPVMQNHAFHSYNIDAVYVPFHVVPNDLSAAVAGLRALNVAGVNVTIPHKETILSCLDQVDPTAQLIGAVNTVVNSNGILIGYNTDASGFINTIQLELGFYPAEREVLILGAGGAGRAATVALASAGVKTVTIANRHQARAEELVKDLESHFPAVQFFVTNFQQQLFFDSLSSVDLIVNSTSVGLHGEDVNFLPLENIKCSALIFDMIYSPTETLLIKNARSLGLFCADGLGMLAAQGEDAFFLWTGIRLPSGFMRQFLVPG
jgi:shikimate dehydrogenase